MQIKCIMEFKVDPFDLFIQWVFINHLLCLGTWDKAQVSVNRAAGGPSPQVHTLVIREHRRQPSRLEGWRIFYSNNTCPLGTENLDVELEDHHPSPPRGTIAITGLLPSWPLPTLQIDLSAKIPQGWPALAVCLVLASPMLPATM